MKKRNPVTKVLVTIFILTACGALMASFLGDRTDAAAKKSYVFKKYLKADDIKIHTAADSVVTLTGTVSEWSHRTLAEETVIGLPGVTRVENKLDVTGGKPDETSDAWIAMKIRFVLMFHKDVSYLKTNVDVKEGVVALKGLALNDAQKELTTEYASDVEGVKSVKNEMKVEHSKKTTVEKVGEYIDDASITSQVKIALLFHKSTSVLKIKVETNNGVVTVSGIAKNSAERELVGKLVENIKGVKTLKNNITLEAVSMK